MTLHKEIPMKKVSPLVRAEHEKITIANYADIPANNFYG